MGGRNRNLGKPQKKISALNGQAIKRGGGGVKGRAIKKRTFLEPFFPKFQRPFREELFFGFP